MSSLALTFILIAASITIAYGQVIQFTSSIPNGDPACPGKNVVLNCRAIGTSIRWSYNNRTIKSYNSGEMCGDYQVFPDSNRIFATEPGVTVSTVLASILNISGPGSVFNCTTILEINSTVHVQPWEIMCVSAEANGTEDTKTFPYTVFMIGENEEFDIQMEQVLGSIYNVTWNVPLAVENIAYITVTVMGTVTVVHPNQTSILLQLEDSNECRVNVTVVDKCDRKYSNSTDFDTASTTNSSGKGISLLLHAKLAIAFCVLFAIFSSYVGSCC